MPANVELVVRYSSLLVKYKITLGFIDDGRVVNGHVSDEARLERVCEGGLICCR